MRLARLAVAGLALGILAGFIAALLRPRRRSSDWPAGEPMARRSLSEGNEPIGWGTRPHRTPLPPLVPVVPKAKPSGPVVS